MLEKTIISNLLYNREFSRKVTPYLKDEYFDDPSIKKVFQSFANYVAEYKEPPSLEALKITIDSRNDVNEDQYKEIINTIDELKIDKNTNQEWLLNETEKFCQDKDLFNSIRRSILILDGKDKEHDKGAIPKLLSDSLGVSFDTHIGHDYLQDFEERYDFYHRKEERIPFDVEILNKITKGGLPRKSLTILLATCVHPETKVRIRKKQQEWEYEEVSIGSIKGFLDEYEIEVDSPDGWVEVIDFVEKEKRQEHILTVETGEKIRCSDTHLFETNYGWMFAKDIANRADVMVLHRDGEFKNATCEATENIIPIVDITVNHENHRYYSNNISSHNTGGGKSLVKCHMAATSFMHGKNVLYISSEMAEERIGERIDANLLNVTLDELMEMPRDVYEKKLKRIKDKQPGQLILKEYPTGSAHAGHFRHLINELKLKKNFTPDIIFVDYLNICASSRIKGAASANSYTLVKSIAEEIRGLAMEFNCPIVSSSQYNRCLSLDTMVLKSDNSSVHIKNLKVGDELKGNEGNVKVKHVFPITKQKTYLIKTKDGKTIRCSDKHIFPTSEGEKSLRSGLKVGDKLKVVKTSGE